MKTNEPEMERTRSVHMEHLDGFRFRVQVAGTDGHVIYTSGPEGV